MARKKKSINLSLEEDDDGPAKKHRITGKNKINSQPETKPPSSASSSGLCLPLDILSDILSRLPTKSVAKCRCVCKQWLSLTHGPGFLKLQYERSSSYMIVRKNVRNGEIWSHDSNTVGYEKDSMKIYCKFSPGRLYYRLSNFVDGLTCAYGYTAKSDIYLLNPMTRELQKLRKNNGQQERFINDTFGLGIDMTMGHCKIVRLFTCSGNLRVKCEIYNMVTMQWRCLGEAPFELFNNSNSVFFHGALHWIGYLPGDRYRLQRTTSIYRFNIKDEKFESPISLPYPSSFDMSLCCEFGLKESREKLWLVYISSDQKYFEIWTMKDYSNKTWVKEYKFHSNSRSSLYEIYDVKEIADGNILFRSYDSGVFAIYKESLFSPKKLLKESQRRKKQGGGDVALHVLESRLWSSQAMGTQQRRGEV